MNRTEMQTDTIRGIFEKYAEKAGWNEETTLIHSFGFIGFILSRSPFRKSAADLEDLEDYLQDIYEEELALTELDQ